MTDLINGRTPEEIKAGLKACTTAKVPGYGCNIPCPYLNTPNCWLPVKSDALALIERLESERDAAMVQSNLISRSAVLETINEVDISDCTDIDDIIDRIYAEAASVPTINAVPMVHARWIDTTPKWITGGQMLPSARLQCSNCGRRTGYRQARTYKYCPKCGARMDEKEND